MEGDKYQIRSMWFTDEDRQKKIEVFNEKFVIKALFPKDRAEVARSISIRQNGLPNNSFSMDAQFIFERAAIVQVGVISSPDWYKGADDCPDEELLNALHEEIVKWTNAFQERLKKNRLPKGSATPGVPA